MEKNCLVSKLKGNVNNDNLPKLGEIIIQVEEYETIPANANLTLHTSESVYVDGDGAISTVSQQDAEQSSVKSLNSSAGAIYLKNGNYKLHITSKYEDVTKINVRAWNRFKINISDFKYCSNLTEFSSRENTSVSGNVADLPEGMVTEGFNFTGSINITGDIKELAKRIRIHDSNVIFISGTSIYGKIEDFANEIMSRLPDNLNQISYNCRGFVSDKISYGGNYYSSLSVNTGFYITDKENGKYYVRNVASGSNISKVYCHGYSTAEIEVNTGSGGIWEGDMVISF